MRQHRHQHQQRRRQRLWYAALLQEAHDRREHQCQQEGQHDRHDEVAREIERVDRREDEDADEQRTDEPDIRQDGLTPAPTRNPGVAGAGGRRTAVSVVMDLALDHPGWLLRDSQTMREEANWFRTRRFRGISCRTGGFGRWPNIFMGAMPECGLNSLHDAYVSGADRFQGLRFGFVQGKRHLRAP